MYRSRNKMRSCTVLGCNHGELPALLCCHAADCARDDRLIITHRWCIVKADIETLAKSNRLPIFLLDSTLAAEASDKVPHVTDAVLSKVVAVVEDNLW